MLSGWTPKIDTATGAVVKFDSGHGAYRHATEG